MASAHSGMLLAGVIGWPVAHSKSPRLHGHWLARHNVHGAYLPLAVAPDAIEAAVRGLPALGFRGANVTLPHKVAAARLADRLTDRARRLRSVNTLIVAEDGALLGDSTDGYGFWQNLEQAGVTPLHGPVLVVGAGGAAPPVVAALLDGGVPEVRIANRSSDKVTALIAAFDADPRLTPVAWADRADALTGVAGLVNATSLGMVGQPALDLPLDRLPTTAVVTDLVYAPLETPLLAAARARGNPTVDGLGMLLHQARPGFHAWFGVDPAVDADLRAAVLA